MYKPDYSTANDAIKREWAFWRRIAKRYGFGRHQLQPMRENGEALGRYLGEYLSKDWNHRLPEDKGARCIRYFGHWSRTERKEGERRKLPPNNSRFGWMTPRARAWRETGQTGGDCFKIQGREDQRTQHQRHSGAKVGLENGPAV